MASKRGAHLALSLERLQALVEAHEPGARPQRIGCSATVRPVEDALAFLTGATAHEPIIDRRRLRARPRRAGRGAGRRLPHGHQRHGLGRGAAADRRAGPGPPHDARLRPEPPRRRASGPRPQRPHPRRPGGGPPRLALAPRAAGGREPAEGRRAAGAGGHLLARARHRRGRHRPRRPGAVAAQRRRRPAAGGPRRPPALAHLEGPDRRHQGRRADRGGGGRPLDPRSASSTGSRCPRRRSTCSPSRSSPRVAAESLDVDTLHARFRNAAPYRGSDARDLRRASCAPSPSRCPLEVKGAAPADPVGPRERPAARAPRQPVPGADLRRHHPRRRPLRRLRRRDGSEGRHARRGVRHREPARRRLPARLARLEDRQGERRSRPGRGRAGHVADHPVLEGRAPVALVGSGGGRRPAAPRRRRSPGHARTSPSGRRRRAARRRAPPRRCTPGS